VTDRSEVIVLVVLLVLHSYLSYRSYVYFLYYLSYLLVELVLLVLVLLSFRINKVTDRSEIIVVRRLRGMIKNTVAPILYNTSSPPDYLNDFKTRFGTIGKLT
jgi:hypothetical protein